MTPEQIIRNLIPLTESTYHALLVVREQPSHGYRIKLEVEKLGGVDIAIGNLYVLLNRLQREGLLERITEEEGDTTRRNRKTYGLTLVGTQVLDAHILWLGQQLSYAKRGEKPGGSAPQPAA